MMPDEIRPIDRSNDVIIARLTALAKELNTLSTVLLGVVGTDSKGMAGDITAIKRTVECHNKDISRIKTTLYVLIALTLGTGGTVVTRLIGS